MMKNIKDFNLQTQFTLVCRELQGQYSVYIIEVYYRENI